MTRHACTPMSLKYPDPMHSIRLSKEERESGILETPWYRLIFSRNMGQKSIVVYHEYNIHVNLYWFVNYHPEDTGQGPQEIEDDPNKLYFSVYNPKGMLGIAAEKIFEESAGVTCHYGIDAF